jgi:hypothetical protein
MSLLGHKQTYAVHQPMSALPPIATAKADMPQWSCLLYPRKRTCAAQTVMSALGQKRTFVRSLDYLVSGYQQAGRHSQAKGLRSFDVDGEFELGGRLCR